MIKQSKVIATLGAMATALLTSSAAFAQEAPPLWSETFRMPATMTKMDNHNDARASRQNIVDNTGTRSTSIEANDSGTQTKAAVTDRNITQSAFPVQINALD